ncbi:lipopolysaccharide biosynthesis protein [Mucilaginibacter boryungensis]|uniref:Oligosaccharide flippase family protein n=1 Tax=Mucilaginibacter boryungensis TaxID=768480 RepID=A0ABR9XHZ9_9SPHI|nr:oligosaccharide flippase family protein [Mucilaginibacter boryungensis]MBE9666817.1 oligosaccharide flippase family protein [Mucilaginibacter boryungensis]
MKTTIKTVRFIDFMAISVQQIGRAGVSTKHNDIKLQKVIKLLKGYINSLSGGKERTTAVNFNIIVSFVLRALSIIVSFLTISFSLKLLDTNKYGIWLAISSTVSWISILDIGLANGLRNKVAEYLAVKNYKEAKIAVSSTYAILFMIVVPILLLFGVFLKYAHWNSIFNTKLDERELLLTIAAVFIGLLMQFFLKPIASILQGDQKIYKSNLIQLLCNFIPLVPIIFFSKYLHGSMFALAIAQTVLPVVVLIAATVILFRTDYKHIRPSLKQVNLAKSKSLFGLSLAFFIVQIAWVFLYSTSELIITHEFGGSDVTLYNLLYKYFSTTGIILNIILTSYWSAFTNAFALFDFAWIKASIRSLVKIASIFLAITLLQLVLVVPVFKIWVGNKVHVPFILSCVMAIYFCVNLYTTLYSIVLNGTGKVKMQAIVSLITALLHVPVVLVFIRYFHWGLNSLVYASILWTVIQVLIWKKEINSALKKINKTPKEKIVVEPELVFDTK